MGLFNRVPNPLGPAEYEAWYHTPRGEWIGETEFSLLLQLMRPGPGQTVLDVGCGSGYFSRRFANVGLAVTGIDPDPTMLEYARSQTSEVDYLQGSVLQLPFENEAFDDCTAITSLCFVNKPMQALTEMWRVCRYGIAVGLLNRRSLLYRQKHGRGGYKGARWDTWPEVAKWQSSLKPLPVTAAHRTAIFFPSGKLFGHCAEHLLPNTLPWGGFLAIYLSKAGRTKRSGIPKI